MYCCRRPRWQKPCDTTVHETVRSRRRWYISGICASRKKCIIRFCASAIDIAIAIAIAIVVGYVIGILICVAISVVILIDIVITVAIAVAFAIALASGLHES